MRLHAGRSACSSLRSSSISAVRSRRAAPSTCSGSIPSRTASEGTLSLYRLTLALIRRLQPFSIMPKIPAQ